MVYMMQIDLFELLDHEGKEEETPSSEPFLFEVGEMVKVRKVEDEDKGKLNPEDYYYLKDFSNKKGKVTEVLKSESGKISYKIEFDKDYVGYFYSNDLILI